MIRIESMEEKDYIEHHKQVQDGFDQSNAELPNSLNSKQIFGTNVYAPGENKPISTHHKRGYIKLYKPVINFAVAQKDAALFCKILGVDKQLKEDVVRMRVAYDPKQQKYIPIDQVQDANRVLLGAEILKMWIDKFDIEESIQRILNHAVNAYKKKKKYKSENTFKMNAKSGYRVAGDWFFIPDNNVEDYSDLVRFVGEKVFNTRDSRLSYLLNLQGRKRVLYSAIIQYVMVLPIGMRPDVDGRHSQLTCSYDEVISANKNLAMVSMGVFDMQLFVSRYRELSSKVDSLLATTSTNNPNRKSILEKLKTKKGHIRSKLLGRRIDYSGRFVITIDPFLSLKKIRIPRDMAPKLFRSHILSSMSKPNPADWIGVDKTDKCDAKIEELRLLEKIMVLIGRQPTLHKPSIRAFNAELTEGRSMCLNPLCVEGYNADFDGDMMWLRVPVSQEAIDEVNELMGVAQNFYYPKNGAIAFLPRQEIIYGLNVCTRDNLVKGSSKKTYKDYSDLLQDLVKQVVGVEDTVTLDGITDCAGRVAFVMCFPKSVRSKLNMEEVTTTNIAAYVELAITASVDDAIDTLDNMVFLGFKMGYLYPPTLNLLDDVDKPYADAIETFHNDLNEISQYYDRGMVLEEEYNLEYDEAFNKMERNVASTIYDVVGEESGFTRLEKSGARGSKKNLVQMYGYKGRIQKSPSEAFRAVVEHSYTEMLIPIEHFVTAYGSREGLMNKSLRTADTGYLMRQIWHATQPYVIKQHDCGTKEGIVIKKSDIAMFVTDVDDVFRNIITGRYEAGTNRYISRKAAEEICANSNSVTIRSIMTCKDPCCKLCYGTDPSTRKLVATTSAIGFAAAESIGEPGTQLSMDSFKSGGLASNTGVTSAFDKLSSYIHCRSLKENPKYGAYDPIAWKDGEITEKYKVDGRKEVRIKGSMKSITIPGNAVLKEVAVKGEGICLRRGDYDINELLEYAGLERAQMYLLHTLYNIYKSESEIDMKHFEVLVASMTMSMVIGSDRSDLKVGQYHDSIQMRKGSTAGTDYIDRILDVGDIQKARTQALSRIALEDVKAGLASSMLLGLEDDLEYPLNCMMMGKKISCGGKEFRKERKI